MSKRITAVAASALALALGCEQQGSRTGEDDQIVGQHEERVTDEETGFNQEPADQRRQQQMQQRQPGQQQQGQMGQQQHGQMGQGQGSPGQIVTEQSQNNLDRTLSQLNRQLRENDFDVVATVRYDERMRERAMREQGQQGGQQQARQQQQQQRQQGMQQGQQGMQQGGQGQQIGDVRLILFRRTNEEAQAIQNQGPEVLLKQPRALLVYERGNNVIVSYQTPEDMPAVGMEEPTTEVLQRIVRESTQGRQQQTAQREQQQQEQQAQRMEQQGQREQQRAQGLDQQAQRDEQQAQRDEQQAQRERQAMTQPRQGGQQTGIQN